MKDLKVTNTELREKLVGLLRVTPCKDVGCDKCKDAGDDCWLGKHADYLIANGVTLNQWISVEDEEPKRRGHYFIAFKFKGSDMRFFGEAMWYDDIPDNGFVKGDHFSNEGVEGMYVTHWMKIPPLPSLLKEIEE